MNCLLNKHLIFQFIRRLFRFCHIEVFAHSVQRVDCLLHAHLCGPVQNSKECCTKFVLIRCAICAGRTMSLKAESTMTRTKRAKPNGRAKSKERESEQKCMQLPLSLAYSISLAPHMHYLSAQMFVWRNAFTLSH